MVLGKVTLLTKEFVPMVIFVITCSSVNPLCHRLEYIPDKTIILRKHLEIFRMRL